MMCVQGAVARDWVYADSLGPHVLQSESKWYDLLGFKESMAKRVLCVARYQIVGAQEDSVQHDCSQREGEGEGERA